MIDSECKNTQCQQSKGVLESLLEMAPVIIEMARKIERLEQDSERRNESAGVTLQRAAELISGEAWASEGCISEKSVMKLVHAGCICRIPASHLARPVLISRRSIYEYMGKLEPEY